MTIGRKASSWIFVAVTSAALTLAACSKSGDKAGTSGPKGANKAAASAFAYLPKDSATLVGISVAITQGVLKELVSGQMSKRLPPQFQALKEKCNIDLLGQLKTAVLAMGADPKDKKSHYVVVTGTFDKTKINDCVSKTKADGKTLFAKADGKLTAYSREDDDRVFYAWWPNNNTVVFSAAPNNKAGVLARIDQKKSVSDNKRLMALIKDVNTSAGMWLVGDVALPGGAERPDGTLIELNASNEVGLKLRMRYAESASADKAKTHLEGMLAKLKKSMVGAIAGPYLADLKLSTKGRDMVVDFSLDKDMLDKAMSMAKRMGVR